MVSATATADSGVPSYGSSTLLIAGRRTFAPGGTSTTGFPACCTTRQLSVPAGWRPWGPDEFGSRAVQAGEFPPVVLDVDGQA